MDKEEAREYVEAHAEVHQTGRWYIAELDTPQLAMQGESEKGALEKLATRLREYREQGEGANIVDSSLGTYGDDVDPYQFRRAGEDVIPDFLQ